MASLKQCDYINKTNYTNLMDMLNLILQCRNQDQGLIIIV